MLSWAYLRMQSKARTATHHYAGAFIVRGRINVGWLLSMLEDPFEIFPLQSIGDELARSVAVSKEALHSL